MLFSHYAITALHPFAVALRHVFAYLVCHISAFLAVWNHSTIQTPTFTNAKKGALWRIF
jgi:hypothetical protein